MAIVITGKTICALCGQVIAERQEVIGFPPFIPNEADPLHIFSDQAFHAACFRLHPLSRGAEARYVELRERSAPATRMCLICGRAIADPDDYLGLGHLTADATKPIHEFNYAQFHRTCLARWTELERVCGLLRELKASGTWQGLALD